MIYLCITATRKSIWEGQTGKSNWEEEPGGATGRNNQEEHSGWSNPGGAIREEHSGRSIPGRAIWEGQGTRKGTEKEWSGNGNER